MSKRLSHEYFENLTDEEENSLIDTGTDRERLLYQIYDFEPELYKEYGESLLSEMPCKECTEKTVYLGPDINVFENNRCMICGTIQV